MFQCCIDLKRNVLHIGTTGTETLFLSERDLPECARLSSNSEEVMETMEDKDMQEAILRSRQNNPSGESSVVEHFGNLLNIKDQE